MSGSTVLELPGRDPKLPVFFRFNAHPLIPNDAVKEIYVYWADTSEKGNLTAYEFLEALEFPEGTEAKVDKAGQLKLYPGDKVFARDMYGSHKEIHDVEQVWILQLDRIPEAQCITFMLTRDRFLDSQELRTPSSCKRIKWTVLDRKKIINDQTDHGRMRLEGIQAATALSMTTLHAGPAPLMEALERQAEVLNLLRVGNDDNFTFATMQVNLSATKRADTNARDSFKSDLGQFAGKHIDQHDSYGGVTCMITLSDLEETDQAGFFIVSDLGVAIGPYAVLTFPRVFHG